MHILPLQSAAAALLVFAASHAGALTLYDPASGLPAAQGWSTVSSATAGSDTIVAGRLRLDTTGVGVSQHGHFRSATTLDTATGYVLQFGLQVRSESTSTVNRAGVALLLQGQDQTKSLELAFLDDKIWALRYTFAAPDNGFVQGEGVAFDTSSVFRNYTLTVQNNAYSLSADGQPLLSGLMRDYPTLPNSPGTLVYGQSNLLFFGDNTSQASGVFDVGSIVLSPVPEPGAAWLLLAGLSGLAWRARRASTAR
jgi:opacity protein-like surface antigen